MAAIVRARRAALACLTAWGMGGCSWAFMTRPPEGVVQPAEPVHCTESKGAPTLDWVAGGSFFVPGSLGLITAGAICSDDQADSCTRDLLWVALGSLAAMGLGWVFILSAKQGTADADRCLELRCASGVEASCRKLPPPPPAPEPSPPWDAATDVPPPPELAP